MIYNSEFLYDIPGKELIGVKAYNLCLLRKENFPIPSFHIFSNGDLENYEENAITIKNYIDQLSSDNFYAVRSSAISEDGKEHSFAGQFSTVLFVHKKDLLVEIFNVYNSTKSNHVNRYKTFHQIEETLKISVIVQEMIHSDISGVAFGVDPMSLNPKTKVINAIYGQGEALVSGKYDSDFYSITDQKIHAKIVNKPFQIVLRDKQDGGCIEVQIPKEKQSVSVLSNEQIIQVVNLLEQCGKYFGHPQDIEFAFESDKLYLLQSRPITTLQNLQNRIVWDNSNIIESYPGVTTPLTFSFISRSYEYAYKSFSVFMGVKEETIKKHESIFQNTLGLLNGRVYYNLKTWYHMLAMLPGYKINARFMEKMMGVKESFDVPDELIMSKKAAHWQLLVSVLKLFKRHFSLSSERTKFMNLVEDTISSYKAIDFHSKSSVELIDLYLLFERKLLDNWKAPLLNDFFAMIWFGLLQKECLYLTKSADNNLHNNLLCGSNDIISTQPIYRTIEIATLIRSNKLYVSLFQEDDNEFIFHLIQTDSRYNHLYYEIQRYLNDFGERCIGELKLETKSYQNKPSKFIQLLKSYLINNIEMLRTGIDESIRHQAERTLETLVNDKPIRKFWINLIVRKTRELISARENLRYERSRAFGIVRELFASIGRNWSSAQILDHEDDIFYLTREEIIAYRDGRSVDQNLKKLVVLRKIEFDSYKRMELIAERITSSGLVYQENNLSSDPLVEESKDILKGVGCSPGIIRAKARVVLHPEETEGLNGEILVTHSTDPGWVVLFPSAAAIIVERGSLLSHSAIVSREMGKPCIVGVTGLLKQICTGDELEINGSTGVIRILERNSKTKKNNLIWKSIK